MAIKRTIAVLALCVSLAGFGCDRNLSAGTTFAAKPKLSASNESRLLCHASGLFDAARIGRKTLVAVGKQGEILRSKDGGNLWRRVASKTSQPLLSVAFSSEKDGVIVGAGGTYLESADGASSWTARSIGVRENLFSVRFFQHGTGFIVGAFGTLLKTDNDGKTWHPVNLNWDKLLPKLTQELGLVQPHLYGVAFCDPQHGWIVGEYGLILGTEDGGKTWQWQAGGGMEDRQLFDVAVVGPGRAVAAGQGGKILYTSDYGNHWVVSLAPGGLDIYAFVPFGSGSRLLALGDLGAAFVSTDGGRPESWRSVNLARGAGAPLADTWLAAAISGNDDILAFGQLGVWRLELNPADGSAG